MKEQSSNVGRTLDAVTVWEAERSNSGRTLDVITAEIQQIERRNVFDIGKLLVEANKVCDHGDWLPWLKAEFEWSHDTARNYMNAYRLADDDERVRNLTVPLRIIYALANDVDEYTPGMIDALVEATKGGKKLSVSEAEDVAAAAYRRSKYGDYPEAALDEMAAVDGEPWGDAAIAALKAARPTTAEEVRAIADSAWQAYKASNAGDNNAGAEPEGREESADEDPFRNRQDEDEDEADGDHRDRDDDASSAQPEPEDEDEFLPAEQLSSERKEEFKQLLADVQQLSARVWKFADVDVAGVVRALISGEQAYRVDAALDNIGAFHRCLQLYRMLEPTDEDWATAGGKPPATNPNKYRRQYERACAAARERFASAAEAEAEAA
jgi:Protein of unknown function (DUF3102)